MRLDYHPESVDEYERAVEYYAAISPSLAARFIEEIESRIALIKESPLRWERKGPNTRIVFGNVFPYNVLYAVGVERILILAIMHQKQKPDYWVHRQM